MKTFLKNLDAKAKWVLGIYFVFALLIIIGAICLAILINPNGLFLLFALFAIIPGTVGIIRGD